MSVRGSTAIWFLATAVGVELGRRALDCPPALAVGLAVLGLGWRGLWGLTVFWLGVGLALGTARGETGPRAELDRPVVLVTRRVGAWRPEEGGWSAPTLGEWLHQGLRTSRWRRRVRVVIDTAAPPPPGLALRVRGYLRRAPPPANGLEDRAGPWLLRSKSLTFVEARPGAFWLELLARASDRSRDWIEGRLQGWPEARAGPGWHLTQALLLGDASQLPRPWSRGLRSAGLSHLMALSGLHVGLLAGAGLLLGGLVRGKFRFALPISLLAGYLLLAGLRPSLIRATLMLLAVGAAWWLERRPQPLNSLSWVAIFMVLTSPQLLQDLGFQLTVAATAGLLLLAPRLEERWGRLPSPVRKPLSLSVGAQLGALPWTLSSFHVLAPLAPLWNLWAVPWTALSLITTMLWLSLALLMPAAARQVQFAVDGVATPFAWLGEISPMLTRPTPAHLGGWGSLLVTLLLAGGLITRRLALGIALLSLAWSLVACGGERPRAPRLALLDVGQGDAILLQERGFSMLVDGGGWRQADIAQRVLLPALSRLGVRQLDALFLTHPDQDHCGGLLDVTSYLPVRRLYTVPGWGPAPCIDQLLTRPRLPVRALWRGEALELGGWRIRVLHPAAGDRGGRNNRSLVLLVEVAGHRLLLTGDLEGDGELDILDSSRDTLHGIEILKVAHHGSRSSTSASWLMATRPRLALISCGLGNRYGHPSPIVLARLEAQGIPVLRTDVHGVIEVQLAPLRPLRVRLPGSPRDPGG